MDMLFHSTKMKWIFFCVIYLTLLVNTTAEIKGYFQCSEPRKAITCSTNDLPGVIHGSFDCLPNVNVSHSDVCTLTCDDKFYSPFSNQAVCETAEDNRGGKWSDENFACHAITCSINDLPDVTHASFDCPSSGSSVSHGDTCNLICNHGFYSELSNQTVCEAAENNNGGKWSDENFTCRAITCPVTGLPGVSNGSFECPSSPDVSYGDFCTIVCNHGFYSAFSNSTVCEGGEDNPGGKWSDRNIACHEITCSSDSLPVVMDGSFDCVQSPNTSVGEACSLICDDGFYPVFSDQVVCELREYSHVGRWSEGNFTCNAITCSTTGLPNVKNGTFACPLNSNVPYSHSCDLICTEGFYSPFSNQAVCEALEGDHSGKWSEGNFACHEIKCSTDVLPEVPNGSFDCPSNSNVSYGDSCTISCNNGFYSAFSNDTVCEGGEDNKGGEWSDSNIACRAITCSSDRLPVILDGSFVCVQSPNTSVGEACSLICDDGFYPAFSDQVICELGENSHVGSWSEGNFTCHAITCSTTGLPNVKNGTFACPLNYNVPYSHSCDLICIEGFYSPFSNQAVCEAGDGNYGEKWSEGNFVCHEIKCSTDVLPEVPNGSFDCLSNSNVSYGDSCTISCNNGFYSAFSNDTVCEEGEDNQGGKWSDRNIACRAITCSSDSLPVVPDGSFDCVQSPNTSVGEACSLICDDGFYSAFSDQVVCELREYSHVGRWSEGNFTCNAITCSTTGLPNVKNGTFACLLNDNVPYSHSCDVICIEGFYSPFSNHAVCEAGEGNHGGEWSKGNFACHEIKCSTDVLPEVPNGSFDCPSNFNVSFADFCTLMCNIGFYSPFANQAVCGSGEGNEGGKWSGGNFVCLAITCSTNDLPDVINGSFNCPPNSNVSYDDACALTCNEGFFPPFSKEAICHEKEENQGGQWSEANFACHGITCSSDNLPIVIDGSFDCAPNSNISMGDACTLMCTNGFYPTLSEQAVCESREDNTGGKWSHGNFTCNGCTVWKEWRGNEYKMTSSKQTADVSFQVCEDDSGQLVSIENHEENSFVQKIVIYCDPNNQIWIGLNDAASPGDWRWPDGTMASFTNWASSQPNNELLEEYVYMKDNGYWYDYPWFHSFHAVCKRSN